ncbi:single-stranded DNA-binding protein [Schaalia sp. 19OD2882]|uniref:Jag family protein n=1 Tax=Schaalia sp. 19OD2882 TaxID=2794089 RepID=UPI001C1F0908|nr:R3H domain-containing nucleic acid-binding protein [Schaalia sp. 19OD2882]QWW19571.1 single-stranded DNA-binding protein [Schaalia sp. 19OD2882]
MSDTTKEKLSRLEEEGELAADYLEELLDIADLDGDIEIDVENGRASVEILSEIPGALDHLVGDDGEVLDALQELTRLAVQTETGDRSRLMLDVAGHRAGRKAQLQALTEEAITRVRTTGQDQRLEPMNPFERKVCHDVVAAAGLISESEGVEPHRRVVILAEVETEDVEVDVDRGESKGHSESEGEDQ